MARLKDLMDKQGNFYERPPAIVQTIEPADDVADQILEHSRYGFQLISLTPINFGPHAGRMLLLFQQGPGGSQGGGQQQQW